MSFSDIKDLSEREQDILRLVATGASNKEIAAQLFISSNTVKVHLRNIFNKIGAASRTEAAMYAVRSGLVQSPLFPVISERENGVSPLVETGSPLTSAEIVLPVSASKFKSLRRWIVVIVLCGLFLGLIGVVGRLWQRAATQTATPGIPTAVSHWQQLVSMPSARSGLAISVYENQLYAIGGETAKGVTDVVERYDLTSNAWTSQSPKPIPVTDVSAATIGGRIYLPGGRTSSGVVTNSLEIYDPRQDKWEQGTPLPRAISAYALAVFEGRIYLFGGWDGQEYVDEVYEYMPDRGSWAEHTAMPTARGFASAAVAGGKIYILGGRNEQGALNVNEVYLPDYESLDQHWIMGAPMPDDRYAMGATSIADTVYVIGGIINPSGQLSSLMYLPTSNTWQVFSAPYSQTWSHLSLLPSGDHLLIVGGLLGGKPTDVCLSYQAIYTIVIPLVR